MNSQSTRSKLCQALLGLMLLSTAQLNAASFVYEGQLDDRGTPANGGYDIQLAVYRDAELGATVTAPIVFAAVEVVDGRFRLDFDAKIEVGESAWVELAVRDAGAGGFSVIPGRTKAVQAPAAIGACWSTLGDSGSNPATHFLGTTDAQPLVLRTRNVQSLRIEPSVESVGGNPITANVIAGSSANTVAAGVRGATISGGGLPDGDNDPNFSNEAPNRVTDAYGNVGGGYANRAGDDAGTTTDSGYATVGGGRENTAGATGSTISGGRFNNASGTYASVGGGVSNSVIGNPAMGLSGLAGVVSGGSSNFVLGDYGTIAGGVSNTVYGIQGSVPGGSGNCAGAAQSWAGGTNAKVRPGTDPNSFTACDDLASYPGGNGDVGSFVWADSNAGAFLSSGPNQFAIRASGGLLWAGSGINSTTSPAFIHQASIGSNTCDGGSGIINSRTWINHPLLNNNPNAVIVLTPNYGSTAGGGVAPPRNPIGLYYNAATAVGCPAGRWVIYQLTVTAETLLNGARFNAWFVLP